jgi:hypothetical protein
MFNARLYGFWGSLTEALRTGAPQNERSMAAICSMRSMLIRAGWRVFFVP